ncbi:unnamed protein product [Toxocara canis]|uniref:non-specific serine/threonine protein kinase n=1 Tax=Toxocara canis TaxID=6265 RepID=A0A3P7HC00_TOXCA|nr:unnamed protein product [Toxocara canis]
MSEVSAHSVFRDRFGGGIPLEIAVLQKCRNTTGVVRMLDWYEHATAFVIVMERPERCQDLFDYITCQGRIAEGLAKNFFKQILDTVIACAWKGILHRDGKDENVVINLQTGSVKLIDFGCAILFRGNSAPLTHFERIPLYSPPQWIMFSRYDGLQVAVWSLGILRYDMVCGDVPFHSEREIIWKGSLSWSFYVSTYCRDLVERCLRHNPRSRCALDAILDNPWMDDSDLSLPISAITHSRAGHEMPNINVLHQLHTKLSVDKPLIADPFGENADNGSSPLANSVNHAFPSMTIFGQVLQPLMKPSDNFSCHHHRPTFRCYAHPHLCSPCGSAKAQTHVRGRLGVGKHDNYLYR